METPDRTSQKEAYLASLSERRISSIERRFWANVRVTPDGCWEWQASKDRHGYGEFSIGPNPRAIKKAHRASYWLAYRALPELVMHTCDNRICVRPSHLLDGTPLENTHDMLRKHRNVPTSGERNFHSKLTADQVKEIRQKHSDGQKGKDLALFYGVSAGTISVIVNRRNWFHI